MAMNSSSGGSVTVEIDHPEKLSRLLIFVKWLLAIPHYLVLYVLGIVAIFAFFLAFVATLIGGTYPRSLFDFFVGYERWRLRLTAYLLLQTDKYPAFGFADDPSYPARLEVEYPQRVARWRPLLTWLFVIPAAIVAAVLFLLAEIVTVLAFFAILITGGYPQSMFEFVTSAIRLTTKTAFYMLWITPDYPLG
jgi:hypothetical protein